jgi:hypothetical protein
VAGGVPYRACLSVGAGLQPRQDDQVYAAIQGTYETKIMGSDTVRAGILMATPTRLIFYGKKLGGYDLESFAYRNISSFEQSKGMMGHTISFFASGNKVAMKWVSDAAAMQSFCRCREVPYAQSRTSDYPRDLRSAAADHGNGSNPRTTSWTRFADWASCTRRGWSPTKSSPPRRRSFRAAVI